MVLNGLLSFVENIMLASICIAVVLSTVALLDSILAILWELCISLVKPQMHETRDPTNCLPKLYSGEVKMKAVVILVTA